MSIQQRGTNQMGGVGAVSYGPDWSETRRKTTKEWDQPQTRPSDLGPPLKLFMTPSEIHANYQPLDADREDVGDTWGGTHYTASAGTPASTARATPPTPQSFTSPSGGRERDVTGVGNVRHGVSRWGQDTGGTYRASTYGTKYRPQEARQETDEELWERKHEEAYDEWGNHRIGTKDTVWAGGTPHYHGGETATADLSTRQKAERSFAKIGQTPTTGGQHPSYWTEDPMRVVKPGRPGTTLGESIEQEGVMSPVRLGENIGSMGKRQIVGGHHRLAVQSALDSEQLVPVLHHEDIYEARSQRTQAAYKYT